jgi:hypothetical protein
MDESSAIRIVDHVRRFADSLMVELRALERQLPEAEKKAWQRRFGNALGPFKTTSCFQLRRFTPT